MIMYVAKGIDFVVKLPQDHSLPVNLWPCGVMSAIEISKSRNIETSRNEKVETSKQKVDTSKCTFRATVHLSHINKYSGIS